jgi:hypothetical protein
MAPGSAFNTLPVPYDRIGYFFEGWFTGISGGERLYSSSVVPAYATTYYARWSRTDLTPVSNITGIPTAVPAGTPVTLNGRINPSNATNQDIMWSMINTGTTGAYINGNTLYTSATSRGSLIIMATIRNGLTTGVDYTQHFNINIGSSDPLIEGASEWAKPELMLALNSGIVPNAISMGGWQSATSRLAAAEAIVRLVEMATGQSMTQLAADRGWNLSLNRFADTTSDYATFLKYAGVSNGIGNNYYDPNGVYDRAQCVTMIGRVAERFFGYQVRGVNPFTDLGNAYSWAAPYVGYASYTGITNGVSSTQFNPSGVLQNQETALFCYRALNVWP